MFFLLSRDSSFRLSHLSVSVKHYFLFFQELFRSCLLSCDSLFRLSHLFVVVKHYFFENFSFLTLALLRALRYSITSCFLCQQVFLFFSLLIFHKSFSRILFAKHFHISHKKTTFMLGGCSQTQRVGFEPTCPLGQTVFKTASL